MYDNYNKIYTNNNNTEKSNDINNSNDSNVKHKT